MATNSKTTLRREHRPRGGDNPLGTVTQLFPDEGTVVLNGQLFVVPSHLKIERQIRDEVPREKIARFRESIARNRLAGAGIGRRGIHEAVKVIEDPDKAPGTASFIVHDGHARTLAAQELEADRARMMEQGVEDDLAFADPYLVPVYVLRDTSEVELAYSASILNWLRDEPNDIEMSRHWHRLIKEHHQTVEQIAERHSVNARFVKEMLALVRMAPDVQRMMEQRNQTKSAAEKINRIKTKEKRAAVIKKVLGGAGFKEIEKLAAAAIEEEIKESGALPPVRKNEPTPTELRDAILGDLRRTRSVLAMERGKLDGTRRRVWDTIQHGGDLSAQFCADVLTEQRGIEEQVKAMRAELDAIEQGVERIVYEMDAESIAERAA